MERSDLVVNDLLKFLSITHFIQMKWNNFVYKVAIVCVVLHDH